MTDPADDNDAFERARASWGYPAFARAFPREPALDRLVVAFTRGDYATIRRDAPRLALSTEDEAVRRAADLLLARTRPDPRTKLLFGFTAALLVILAAWWIGHDGPH